MDDFSWIKPATSNLANLFGLNPEAAAKGRNMQADYDFTVARTKNTDADTALSPFRQGLLTAQTGTQGALAGKYKAETGKTEAETAGINYGLEGRMNVAKAFLSGLTRNPDGSVTLSPESANLAMSGFAAFANNPEQVAEAARSLAATSSTNPRFAANTRGIAGSFAPDASFSTKEGQDIQAAKAAASQSEAVAVQQEKNKGSLAESIAKGATGPAAPDQMDLNRQIEAIKEGAAWAMKVPLGPGGGFLNEEQAMALAQAARAANPNLNVPDAIRKFIQDNPGMLRGNWEMLGNNKVDIPNGIPSVVPAAPAAAPAAAAPSTPAAPATPSYIPGSGMPPYRAAPPPATPASGQGMPTKAQFEAMPEGGAVVVNGVKFVKRGRQLVKVR